MQIANFTRIERRTDHYIVHVGMSKSDDPMEMGDELTAFALPLTTGIDLALQLFEGVYQSAPELTAYFLGIQQKVADLNAVNAKLQEQQKADREKQRATGEKK